MNARTARRRRGQLALSAHPIDLASPHNPDCPTAATIATLVRERDNAWLLDPRPCDLCGTTTIADHLAECVWVCMFCGAHGPLDDDTRLTEER